ncbi:MAG: cation:proton antiporter [Alphaproteobacteria bacterium]|nr:cation:proton antiporter [Alphaproteobacteria bacterium]
MDGFVLAVFGLSALLGLASLLVPTSRRLYLPYTVLLALFGAVLGILLQAGITLPGAAGDLLRALSRFHVSSDVLIYGLLPPLLFAGGLSVDVRRLIDEIAPITLLAVVAVMACTLAVGFSVHLVSAMGLTVCLLLGAIVATTDTAAVLSIFRDIGAPRRLSTIVEGESLFNDAAAIALFVLLLDMAMQGTEPDFIAGTLSFIWGLVGGAVFGGLAAMGAAWLVPLLRGAALTEITLTLVLSYLTFVVADKYLEVSGIIAVVVAAITFAAEARTRVSPGTWESLNAIWRQLDFWASTLIFVFAAMVAPDALKDMTAENALALLALYVSALLTRAAILFLLMPLLNRMGIAGPVETRYKLVLLWGAMRGAVTVALALSLSDNEALDVETRRFILVLAVGYVLSTLLINAPTLRPLMRALRLNVLDPQEKLIRDHVTRISRTRVSAEVGRMAKGLGFVSQAAIAEFCPSEASDDRTPLTPEIRLQVGLLALANREAELAITYLDRGTINRDIADAMIEHAGIALESVRTGGIAGYDRAWQQFYRPSWRFKLALFLQHRFRLEAPIASQIAARFELFLVKEKLIDDLRHFVTVQLSPVIGRDMAARMEESLKQRADSLRGAIASLDLQYPDFANLLRRRFLNRVSVGLEEAEYRAQRAQALISEEVFEDLKADLASRALNLQRRPKLDLGLRLTAMLSKVPLFLHLSGAQLIALGHALRPLVVTPGETIIKRGERGDSMYFITAGRVQVMLKPVPVALGDGQFFGEVALLTDQPRNADVIAETFTNLLVLKRRDFDRLLAGDEGLRDAITAAAGARQGASAQPAVNA